MSSSLKPITFYGHLGMTPNPPKVLIFLKLLGLPYKLVEKDMSNDPTVENGIKHSSYTSINPNGRIPAIVDPNQNDIAVWESAAILQYLAEIYDPDHKFSGKNLQERTDINAWIAFQISGQAPMQGQLFWFSFDTLHLAKYKEKAPDHILTRFREEITRIYGILDAQLEKQKNKGSDWIVTDRLTIADVAWITWSRLIGPTGLDLEKLPNVKAWLAKMDEVPAVKAAYVELNPETPKA
ncbi:Glutathione-S-transferase [Dactylellina cionopaga]|nr:Glutathione-S-transferase [Dactylellina cionopaga]